MARVITNGGEALGYLEAGTGDALPIIFLHGVGSDKSVWHPQLAYFGQQRRAIAFDFPGYGESDHAAPGTTRDDYALAVIAAMHNLGVTRAHICGLSLGGVVAIAIHHAARRLCASVTLADTFARHPDGHMIYERSVAGSNDLLEMAKSRVDVLLASPVDPRIRREVIDTMAGLNPAAYRIGAEAVWLADQRRRAQSLDVPTLVLVGSDDCVTPIALSNELVELIPGAKMHVITGAGHLVNLEQPAEFNRLVRNFIEDAE